MAFGAKRYGYAAVVVASYGSKVTQASELHLPLRSCNDSCISAACIPLWYFHLISRLNSLPSPFCTAMTLTSLYC